MGKHEVLSNITLPKRPHNSAREDHSVGTVCSQVHGKEPRPGGIQSSTVASGQDRVSEKKYTYAKTEDAKPPHYSSFM